MIRETEIILHILLGKEYTFMFKNTHMGRDEIFKPRKNHVLNTTGLLHQTFSMPKGQDSTVTIITE
jgi:hypothetical protein